ncbi:conserved hypothetical protein, partial [Ricinus communis]
MKEAIRMVLESIYDSEFPDTSHFRSGRGCHSGGKKIRKCEDQFYEANALRVKIDVLIPPKMYQTTIYM